MKNLTVLLLILVSLFAFVSCKDEPEPPKSYTVTFENNGHGSAVPTQTIQEGQKAAKPSDPTADGFGFLGWYTSEDSLFDFDTAITSNITLRGKWGAQHSVVLNRNGGMVNGDAKATEGKKALDIGKAPAIKDGMILEGYYTTAEATVKVANPDGTLLPSVEGYTDGEGRWVGTADATIYANVLWTITIVDPCNYLETIPNPIYVKTGDKISLASLPDFPSDPAGDDYEYCWADFTSSTSGGIVDFDATVSKAMTISIARNYLGNDFVYTTSGVKKVTGYTGSDTELVIPSIIKGTRILSVAGTDINYCIPGVSDIESVRVEYGILIIGQSAFRNCDNLVRVELPDSLTNIVNDSFSYCDKLTSFTIPDSVKTFGNYVFSGTDNLETITVSSNSNYFMVSGNNSLYSKDGKTLYLVTAKTTSVDILETTETIRQGAFWSNESITNVVIPEGVKTIEGYAFGNNSALVSVTIPKTVETIGVKNFGTSNKLEKVIINCEDVITLEGTDLFGYSPKVKVYVPDALLETYKAATNWSTFADKFYSMNDLSE